MRFSSKEELFKLIQNTLAYPFAWETFGLGELPVEKVSSLVRDRAAHLAEIIWSELVAFEAERAALEEKS